MNNTVSFEEVPDIPKIWIDFLSSRLPVRPAPSDLSGLAARAEAITKRSRDEQLLRLLKNSGSAGENIKRLLNPGTVAVIANIHAGLFGGPAFQILKCLTAIKICEELAKHSIEAVPVGWMSPDPPPEFPKWSTVLTDKDGELRKIEMSPGDSISQRQTAALIEQITELGGGKFDPGVLGVLEKEFSGASLASSCARLIEALLSQWGMIVVDPEHIKQTRSSLLPVLCRVIDPYEIAAQADTLAGFDDAGLVKPLIWPQASATIVDARSRQTLERYKLGILQLYSGEDKVVETIRTSLPQGVVEKLERFRTEVETKTAEVKALVSGGRQFEKTAESSLQKITYQLKEMQKRIETAAVEKEQTAVRRIRKACNFLAPNRGIQERELAGIQMPLKYSDGIFGSVYDKLDIFTFEHQFIFLD